MNMPLMIDLTNKNVVIVGGGVVASRRAQTLNQYVEHMTVISPTITEKLQNMVDNGVVIWKEKEFEPSDIVDAYLLIMLEMHQMAMLYFQVHYTATS